MLSDEYDAVVYDLDGTLVQLMVDWKSTAETISPIITEHGGEAEADDALDLLPVASIWDFSLAREPVSDGVSSSAEHIGRVADDDRIWASISQKFCRSTVV
ncbi:hypothetical protein [Haladaptatus cibarius]|uniref:hypothetical protein n=1 Tax=Haladaptatus cibarius TaxID=453847 RepID=UPI00067862A7|nr:hypothetical protein [Haladaptatus cibarius]